MRRTLTAALVAAPALLTAAATSPARAAAVTHPGAASADPAPAAPSVSPFTQCDTAIGAAAKLPGRLPASLVPAIARVESGRLDPASGKVRPWPWTINVDGVGFFFATKAEVVAAVQTLQAKGKRSIDVGCMQVNLLHHPDAFADLDDAFDPATNARYAVRFLLSLYAQTKDWPLATAYYHSSTPDLGEEYQRLVFGKVVTPMGGSGGLKLNTPVDAWPQPAERFAAIPPTAFNFGGPAPQTPAKTSFGGIPTFSIGTYPNLLHPRTTASRR